MGDNLYGTWGTGTWTYTGGTASTTTTFVVPEYEVKIEDDGTVYIKYGNTYTRYGEIPVVKSVPVVEEPEVEELEMAGLPDIFDF